MPKYTLLVGVVTLLDVEEVMLLVTGHNSLWLYKLVLKEMLIIFGQLVHCNYIAYIFLLVMNRQTYKN